MRRLGTTASTARPGVGQRGQVLLAFAAGTALGALALSSFSPRTVQSVSTTTLTTTKPKAKEKEKSKTYDVPALLSDLRAALPLEHQVSTDAEILHAHGFSENDYHPGSTPTVVVYPDSTEDVVGIVKVARKHGIPVVTYGGGTSLEGHWRAVSRRLFLSLGEGVLMLVPVAEGGRDLGGHVGHGQDPGYTRCVSSRVERAWTDGRKQRRTRTWCASPESGGWTSTRNSRVAVRAVFFTPCTAC